MAEATETLRIDAGDPYLWRVGDVAVVTTLRTNDKTDDLRVSMTLEVDNGEDKPAVRRDGLLTLDPWTIVWDSSSEKPLPKAASAASLPEPLNESHLTGLLSKHREELSWRGRKMLQSRDREIWRKQDFSDYQPRAMMSYRSLFPADFDLVRYVDGRAYFLADYHCVEPNCQCATVTLDVIALDDDGGQHHPVGNASIDLLAPRLAPSGTKAAVTIVRKIMQERVMQKRIAKRLAECRRIAPALAKMLGRAPTTVVQARKVGRNDPCPCGSGKKHKKCCLGKPSAAPGAPRAASRTMKSGGDGAT